MKMKNLEIGMLLSLATIITLMGCKKGEVGPQGPAGAANVRVYHWNSKTTTTGTTQFVDYMLPNEKYSQIDSIEWHFYVCDDTITENRRFWYPLPGTFTDGGDYFRVYTVKINNMDTITFRVRRVPNLSYDPAKTEAIIFKQAKAVLIPAGTLTNLRIKEPINWNDYNDVKKKLNLKEENEILVN